MRWGFLMTDRKIITRYDPPPIPLRDSDWQAVREGYDLGDHIGMGETESAAIADLMVWEEMDR